jgi:hypothetical protein
MTSKRKRSIQLHFMVTEREQKLILEKMGLLGTKNMGAYLRKMAIDGYIIKLDLSDFRGLVSLLHNATNNLNQIARRANESHSIYEADIEDIRLNYDRLWEAANRILIELANIC